MTFTVAVTGSVASGKSTVIRFFANKGIPIVSADEINRQLLEPNTTTFSAIVDHFGKRIVNKYGHLDKMALRDIIFSNLQEKQWLENVLHPIIRQKIVQQVKQASGPYVVVEIPLLKSRLDHPYINRVLLLTVDQKTQIKRIMQRDNCTNEQAEAVIRNHVPFSESLKIADDVIKNSDSKERLFAQLTKLHDQYCALANSN